MSTAAATTAWITRRAFANGARDAAEVVSTARHFKLGKITRAEAQVAIDAFLADGTFEKNRWGGTVPVFNLEGDRLPTTLIGR